MGCARGGTWGEGVEYLRERKVKERRVTIARVRSEPRREKRPSGEDCCWDCFTEELISIGFRDVEDDDCDDDGGGYGNVKAL